MTPSRMKAISTACMDDAARLNLQTKRTTDEIRQISIHYERLQELRAASEALRFLRPFKSSK
ncbi:MAG: hypothetical protein JRM77_06865 [Nitrososphaerota archaeon]|nr:hypothetical protein [Nitrososphaerota archaeon]